MKLGNKGYSMIEMFAVIFIVSLVMFPMLNTLVNNISANARYHNRRGAVSIAQSTIEGFQRMDFAHLQTLVEAENTGNTFYLELDGADCASSGFSNGDTGLCTQLFAGSWSNFTAGTDSFKVYFYNYNMSDQIQVNLLSNSDEEVPAEVKAHIENIETSLVPNDDLYYIICWIEYDESTGSALVMEGLISDEN